jgi:hypothetical protein
MTVRSKASGAEEKFSLRGGGAETVKLIKLSAVLFGLTENPAKAAQPSSLLPPKSA